MLDPVTLKHFAVHLEGVIYEKCTLLEPSGRAEYAHRGAERIERAIENRTAKKGW